MQHRAILLGWLAAPAWDAGIMKTLGLLLLSVSIAACATQQRPTATGAVPSSTAAPTGAVAATPTSGAPAGATPTSAALVADHPADKSNVVDPNILKHGYKPVHRNGQLLYCRSQILTGTHFQNTVCLTEAQVNASERERQETLDQLTKAGGIDCRVAKCN
jgi:hypothetical protein